MSENIIKSKLPPVNIPNISVGEYFAINIKRIIEKNPDKIAFINARTDERVTYQQLHSETLQLSSGFLTQNQLANNLDPHQDLVLFFGDNSLPYITLLMSMAYLGLPVTPSAPANGAYELSQQLRDSAATILCVSTSRLPVVMQILENPNQSEIIKKLKLIVLIDGKNEVSENLKAYDLNVATYGEILLSGGQQASLSQIPYFPVNPEVDHYVIVYTSGSTGLPKGAIHTHRSFLSAIYTMQASKVFQDHPSAIVSFIYPFGHISGTILLANSFASQMTCVLFERPEKEAILRAVEKYQITFLIMFLALSADMVAVDYTKKYQLGSLKLMFFSGTKVPENLSRTLMDRYGVLVHELYGSTELMGGVSKMDEVYEPGNVGEPLPGVEAKIVHLGTGETLPTGEEGELCLRAGNCFLGYLNNGKATSETIDPEGWYHTGDVGYFNSKASLFITDRLKELIKYKHWSVSPSEVEGFLGTHPDIVGACVVGVKHQTEGAHLRAYVQLKPERQFTEEEALLKEQEIVDFVKQNMGYQKRLNAGVQIVPVIPRTIIGKINRTFFKDLVKKEVIVEAADE